MQTSNDAAAYSADVSRAVTYRHLAPARASDTSVTVSTSVSAGCGGRAFASSRQREGRAQDELDELDELAEKRQISRR